MRILFNVSLTLIAALNAGDFLAFCHFKQNIILKASGHNSKCNTALLLITSVLSALKLLE